MKPETCVSCGKTIPEGRQVCPVCENKSKTQNNIKEIRK